MQTIQQLNNYKLTDSPLKIEEIKTLTGANFFSGEQIIRFRLNLGEYDEVFTNTIPNFFENLKAILPSLYEHYCSVGEIGGFFQRVKEGTLLGHVMEHVAIELQTLAGMDVGFGKTRETKKKATYNVIFRHQDEYAGIYAGKAATNLLNFILNNKIAANSNIIKKTEFDIEQIIKNLIFIREKRLLGPSSQSIVNEAKRRNIPVLRLDNFNRIQLGTGKFRKLIRATISSTTSLIAVETTDDKYLTTTILKKFGIPVPKTIITEDLQNIIDFHKKISKTIVIKPAYGNHGNGVSIDLNNPETITKAFSWAKNIDDEIIAQEDILGGTYRFLVIDFKFVAAVRLIPALINGDGVKTINQLITVLNAETNREFGDKGKLSKLQIDDDTLNILKLKNYTLETILPKDEICYLKNSGNMRLGASSIDFTDKIHNSTKKIVERIAKVLNLNVAGIDILSKNIILPLTENNAKVIEVNAAPDFRMHTNPTNGIPRYVQRNFVSMLFPKDSKTQIPIFSITGSQGKSLSSQILYKALKFKKLNSGIISKNGFYINESRIFENDVTIDSEYSKIMLQEPNIDCAIFEIPVESILETGLGYNFADFAIVLNLFDEKPEYLKYDHIRDIEDIAYTKSVIAEQVKDSGYSILNADNELILEMQNRIYSNIILFSENHNNKALKKHIKNSGIAVALKNSQIIIFDNDLQLSVANTNEIPILSSLKQNFKLHSVLSSVAVLYLSDFEINEIRNILLSLDNLI